ncbi:MAG: MFS transporter [Spirochaetota bacterium]
MATETTNALVPIPKWQIAAFYLSSFIAFIVHPMYSYSLIIYTRKITQSDSWTGVVFSLIYAPFAICSLVGGIVSDRYSRRAIIIIASLLTAAFVSAVSYTIHLGHITRANFGFLFVFAAIYGMIVPFVATARLSMIGNVLMPTNVGSGAIFMTLMSVVGYGLGPLIAGFTKENASWTLLFQVNAVGWLVSALGFSLLTRTHQQAKSSQDSHLQDFFYGVKYIFQHKLLLQICLFMSVVAIFVLGPYQTIMPEFLKQTFSLGERQRGSFMAVFGAGLLLGGIIATILRVHRRRGLLLSLSCMFMGTTFTLVSLTASYYPSLFFLFFSGCLGGISNGLVSATMQEESPDRVKGRVMSMYTFILIGMPAWGGLFVSMYAEKSSLAQSIIYTGMVSFLLSFILTIYSKKLRNNIYEVKPKQ